MEAPARGEAQRPGRTAGDTGAIVRAAIAVLDRTGHHPRQRVEVEDKTAPIPLDQLSTEAKRQIIAILEAEGVG